MNTNNSKLLGILTEIYIFCNTSISLQKDKKKKHICPKHCQSKIFVNFVFEGGGVTNLTFGTFFEVL